MTIRQRDRLATYERLMIELRDAMREIEAAEAAQVAAESECLWVSDTHFDDAMRRRDAAIAAICALVDEGAQGEGGTP